MSLILADARQIPLRDGCVQCVVTSPPYWGLRDYGSAGQIGLEATAREYVESLALGVFREVKRVLADSGTLWLNVGDSYANTGGMTGGTNSKDGGAARAARMFKGGYRALSGDMKQKDLVGIPWMLAFALRADGWYLRSDIIWAKPNPMPESVTDRPTKSHEYLFLLTKSERYFYDAAAIAEPVSAAMLQEMEQGYDGLGLKDYDAAGVQNPSSVKARIIENARRRAVSSSGEESGFSTRQPEFDSPHRYSRKSDIIGANGRNVQATNPESERRDQIGTFNNNPNLRSNLMRNKRTVWTVNTQPYAGSHFATMPEKLVEPCILAGSKLGDLVFDPFVGSGTVLKVAAQLGRRGVGTDINPQYLELARERSAQRGLFVNVETPDTRPGARPHDERASEDPDSQLHRSGYPGLCDEPDGLRGLVRE